MDDKKRKTRTKMYTGIHRCRQTTVAKKLKRLTNQASSYYSKSKKSQGRSRMAFPTRMCLGGHKPECKSGRCGKRARLAGEQLDITKFTVSTAIAKYYALKLLSHANMQGLQAFFNLLGLNRRGL